MSEAPKLRPGATPEETTKRFLDWLEKAPRIAVLPDPAPTSSEAARTDAVFGVRSLQDLASRAVDLSRTVETSARPGKPRIKR